jgi:hypothetical protein
MCVKRGVGEKCLKNKMDRITNDEASQRAKEERLVLKI